jgi:DNA-binding FadR family transcriptional regulator
VEFFDPDIFAWRLDSDELEKVMAELYELRHIIEPCAASLAATNAGASDLAYLKGAYKDMEAAAHDGSRFVDPERGCDFDFLVGKRPAGIPRESR